jgi:hypothetical protein
MHTDLLEQARHLATRDSFRPKQANLRRAVSSGYYAIFHFLIDEACNSFIGRSSERGALRGVVARAFQHGEMSRASASFAGARLPPRLARVLGHPEIGIELARLAGAFVEAQEKRHQADYNVLSTFIRQDVLTLLDRIESSIQGWEAVRSAPESQMFLVSLLFWNRMGRFS